MHVCYYKVLPSAYTRGAARACPCDITVYPSILHAGLIPVPRQLAPNRPLKDILSTYGWMDGYRDRCPWKDAAGT